MLRGRINSNRSSRSSAPFSFLLPTCVCLLVLLGPLAHSPVEGQYLQSPCPNVFSYRFTPGTNQMFGFVELHGLPIGQLVKLNIELSIGMAVPENHIGSITLVKSREETLRDIYGNKPAQYHVDFPLNNVIPNVLSISVNGQNICTGQEATGEVVTAVKLEHSLFTQMQPFSIGNGNNFYTIQFQPPQNTAPQVYQPVQTAEPVITERQTQRPVQLPAGDYSSNVECGQPARLLHRRSLNGIRSKKQQFPWAAPIFDNSEPSNPKYICGSTIISTQHLVTVANCMFDSHGVRRQANKIITVPGMYNIDNFFDEDLQERNVSTITIHDDYNSEETGLVDSDIAVLKVDRPIVYDNVIRPICLETESDNLEEIVGVKGFVSGWGITENGNAKYPSYVTATVVDRRSCSRNLEKVITSSARLFCADGHGSVPCTGDSGSGFVIKHDQKYYLRGIVAHGQFDPHTLTCALDKFVIYTDIAQFRQWLSRVIKL